MNHPLQAKTLLEDTLFRVGACVFDPRSREFWVRGEKVALEPRLGALLEILVVNPGITISRDQLLDTVWGPGGSDEALTQAVSRLRRLLDDPGIIKTIPRIGYQLNCTPELVEEDARPDAMAVAGEKPFAVFGKRVPLVAKAYERARRLDLLSVILGGAVGAMFTTLVFLNAFSKQVDTEVEFVVDGESVVTVSERQCGLLSDCQ